MAATARASAVAFTAGKQVDARRLHGRTGEVDLREVGRIQQHIRHDDADGNRRSGKLRHIRFGIGVKVTVDGDLAGRFHIDAVDPGIGIGPVEHEQDLRRHGNRPARDPGRIARRLGRNVVGNGDLVCSDLAPHRRIAARRRARRGAQVGVHGGFEDHDGHCSADRHCAAGHAHGERAGVARHGREEVEVGRRGLVPAAHGDALCDEGLDQAAVERNGNAGVDRHRAARHHGGIRGQAVHPLAGVHRRH